MTVTIRQVKGLRTRAELRDHLRSLDIDLPLADDGAIGTTLGAPIDVAGRTLENRFAVLPMEGWDATDDGRPTELVTRRWARFGASGAALVWGGEAVAVRADGRANPRQLCIGPDSIGDLSALRATLVASSPVTPLVGLQLTHSGRWSRPDGVARPLVAYRHPLLDERVGATDADVLSDAQLDDLVDDYVRAAVVARDAGFDFVDVKHCHGYLLHELLSAVDRPGAYGGPLESRLRFLDAVVAGTRRDAPELEIGVRLSAFDVAPYAAGADGRGVPTASPPYRFAFGGDGSGTGIDPREAHAFAHHLVALGITLVSITAGSPYYSPHVQRPAYFPPSDGYLPPRDPLHEVARLVSVTDELAHAHPALTVVASGLSYTQQWFPAVAAGLVARGTAAFVGYGRGVLAYPELPRVALAGQPLARERLCRTFSDCTTAPRAGLVSGCYPLDPFYKARPERRAVAAAKRRAVSTRGERP